MLTSNNRRLLSLTLGVGLATAAGTVPAAAAVGELQSVNPAFTLYRGTFTTFEAAESGVEIRAGGVNDRGEISGEYIRVGVSESGLYRDKDGRIRPFDVPGAPGTEALKINDAGQIVGSYSDETPIVNNDRTAHGFRWDHGKVDRIDYPGAVDTLAHGINDDGLVCGEFLDPTTGGYRGFTWDRGRFRIFDAPGAQHTALLDVNDRGDMVGLSVASDGSYQGFLYRGGRYRNLDLPGGDVTWPWGINNRGDIVGGVYTATLTEPHAFLLSGGVLTPINVPGAAYTLALGISDSGRISGNFQNPGRAPLLAAGSGMAGPTVGVAGRV